MKLFVIVLCLLSERYLTHASSQHRVQWFSRYEQVIAKLLSRMSVLSKPWVTLMLMLLPLLLGVFIALHFFADGLFGFVGLLLNILIFYACIGPANPFYPRRHSTQDTVTTAEIGAYLADMNGQLFAVIFWYIVLGPLAILAYRLLSLSQKHIATQQVAHKLVMVLDWLPARMTALLYLLVGNFQAGSRPFYKHFFSKPEQNQRFLSECGVEAMGTVKDELPMTLPHAENFVEHAILALLVLLACFTLIAWV